VFVELNKFDPEHPFTRTPVDEEYKLSLALNVSE
jgi:hypothetical protein